ncbi:MAG: aminotransferase class I/II-fold pyridoxal phosphate-dependent enzyme [Solirubrobacteraceae bacterium]
MVQIEARLDELKVLGLQRRTRLVSGPQGPHVVLDGKPVLLCSDNCLGLADHPRVREAAADAATRWGVGAGASRLASGTMTIHRRLEERLAEFLGRESTLQFGSRHLANVGTITALARAGDVVFCDECNHPSIVDGCRLSGAETFVYEHCDTDHLRWGIERAEGRGALIASASVFPIDGDLAPLAEIVGLAQRFSLRTLIDESHALGALGPGGRGALAASGLEDHVDAITGTLGAALGAFGGYVACDRQMARYLVNAAHTFACTALPPPVVAGALAALGLLAERPERVRRLAANAGVLRDGLQRAGFELDAAATHIVPVPLGDPKLAVAVGESALLHGVFVEAIRPPAVPAPAARLRLTAMATHRPEELASAARTLATVARALGFEPRAARAEAAQATTEANQGMDDDRPGRDRPGHDRSGREPGHDDLPAAPGVFDFEAPERARRAA